MPPTTTATPAHRFHIPVMGTGFSIDTPLKVARYGISSVISLVDDVMIEQMRKFLCGKENEEYSEITADHEDARALRITAYLDLLDRTVKKQLAKLRKAPLSQDSDLYKYFEMLPPEHPDREVFVKLSDISDPAERSAVEERLRASVQAGSIDANIMTKLDGEAYRNGQKLDPVFSDALSALRGFAKSGLTAGIVLSAGLNPRLYSYIGQFDDFFPNAQGELKKRIVLKVSDFRSADIQGRFFAKRGLWISEYRIESGVNCGGHAFAGKSYLLGPILEEFRQKRREMAASLHEMLNKALAGMGRNRLDAPLPLSVTVQGGIGTAEEDRFLREHYGVDATGWCTPFLLVPEVTNVDPEHLELLAKAGEKDVEMSDISPLGVPFWTLKDSASERAKRERIRQGVPGSFCPKAYLRFNNEFTNNPVCTASRAYQKLKLAQLDAETPDENTARRRAEVLAKACICHDLAGGATINAGIDPTATTALCCGPNIVNFSRTATLKEMVDHIYGRINLITVKDRPHMFIKELSIYIEYLQKELERYLLKISDQSAGYFQECRQNMKNGIAYYTELANKLGREHREEFVGCLTVLAEALDRLPVPETAK